MEDLVQMLNLSPEAIRYYAGWVIKAQTKTQIFEIEDIYRNSDYLIEEEAHPCFFMLDLENPENMPEEFQVSYDEEDLVIHLDSNLISFQDYHVYIYYHGKPVSDPSGWGGWYVQGDYTYNLGVAFEDDPHSYGRIWHPCFDNFVERSTYEFIVKTANGKSAYCSGVRTQSDTLSADTIQSTWYL